MNCVKDSNGNPFFETRKKIEMHSLTREGNAQFLDTILIENQKINRGEL